MPEKVQMLDAGRVKVIVPSPAVKVPRLTAFSVTLLRIRDIMIPVGNPLSVTV